jgi:hypothetical protein
MAQRFFPLRLFLPLSLGACSSASGPPPTLLASENTSCAPGSIIVATSDYMSSELVLLSPSAQDGAAPFYSYAPFGSDPALASSAGRLFWIDRYGGGVLELDPRCGTYLRGPWLTSDPGAAGSSDPQDIAVSPIDGSVWIARFDVSTLLVKSSDGATDLGTIDLSHVAGMNQNPRMSSIRILGSPPKAYVALEMLDASEQPTNPSYLARLDVATAVKTGKVEATLELKGKNPFGLMVQDEAGSALYLAEPGSVFVTNETDAGIEKVDVASFTSELIARESDIGASVDQLSVANGCVTAIVMGGGTSNPTSLVGVDAATGSVVTPLSAGFLSTSGFDLAGLASLPSGETLVGDRRPVTGKGFAVHVVTTSSACGLSMRSSDLYVPQPPVAFVPGT